MYQYAIPLIPRELSLLRCNVCYVWIFLALVKIIITRVL